MLCASLCLCSHLTGDLVSMGKGERGVVMGEWSLGKDRVQVSFFSRSPLRGSISYDWSQFQAQVLRRGRSRARDHYHVTTESAIQRRSRTERGPTEPRPHHSEACSSVCTKLRSLPKQKKCQEGGRWLWEKASLPCRSQLESDYIFSHLLPSTSGWSWLSCPLGTSSGFPRLH